MKAFFLIFVGGGIGSCLRYFLALKYNQLSVDSFPIGTLLANILSCFILGILIQKLSVQEHPSLYLLIITGLCGGLSTFSTFGYELYFFITKGAITHGFIYIGISMLLSLLAIFLGMKLHNML